jgi:hypothetical protein
MLKDSMKTGTTSSFKIQGTFDGKVHVIGSITFKPEDIKEKKIMDGGIDYSIKYINIPIVLDKGMDMDVKSTDSGLRSNPESGVESDATKTPPSYLFEFTNQSIPPSIAGLKIYNGDIGPDTEVLQRNFVPATKIYLTSNPSIGQSMGFMGQSIGSMGSFLYRSDKKNDINSTKPINQDSMFYEPSDDNPAPHNGEIKKTLKTPSILSSIGSRASSFGFGNNKIGGKTRRRGKTQKRKRSKKSKKTKSKK